MNNSALPCPFCGKKPEVSKHFREDQESLIHRCKVVGLISIEWTAPGHALDLWNQRVAPPTTQALLKLIRDCLDVAGVAGVAEVQIDEEIARPFLAEWDQLSPE